MRLFLAIAPPEPFRERLSAMQHGLARARWVPPENLHLTLRFLGELDGPRVRDLHEALTDISAPRFSLTLSSLGLFGPPRSPRALWTGVKASEALTHLQAKIVTALLGLGLGRETWKFRPHITLARFNTNPGKGLPAYLSAQASFHAPPFQVEEFILYSSALGKRHANYRAEARYPLDTSGAGIHP